MHNICPTCGDYVWQPWDVPATAKASPAAFNAWVLSQPCSRCGQTLPCPSLEEVIRALQK